MDAAALFSALPGHWVGIARTWFEPGQLADESPIDGSIEPVLGGRLLRHTYRGAMQGKPRMGEETIAFNKTGPRWEVSWVDDFHMGKAILHSVGDATDTGFTVLGHCLVGDPHPPWGWRTTYALEGPDQLTIRSHNVMPGEAEALAIEVRYRRVPA